MRTEANGPLAATCTAPSRNTGGWERSVKVETRSLSLTGAVAAALLFGGFAVWAGMAPIQSAAVASGVLVADGHNHRVQHLQGGVIDTVLVHEGAAVRKGDALVLLDTTGPAAERNRLAAELGHLLASQERLLAERDGSSELVFTAQTTGFLVREQLPDVLSAERSQFDAGLALLRNENGVLEARAASLLEQQRGSAHRREAAQRRHAVVFDDVERLRGLQERGVVGLGELSRALQQEAELGGVILEAEAAHASLESSIAETREQISGIATRRLQTAVAGLAEVGTRAASLRQQLNEADDHLARTTIRAPVDGTIVRLHVNSSGSVVLPGNPVLEILPTGSGLLAEVRVSPADISRLSPGQDARVRFPGLAARVTEEVGATLDYVSADRLEDAATGRPYYVSRLHLGANVPEDLKARLIAGTPVEVFFTTGTRTFFGYVLGPLTDSLSHAFRES